ncbi:MAG: aldose 1-epimerase [Rhizobiales bacterium]|nr:aldose 1-epimerase [Hyphomicrobiales bacterium]
MGEIRNGRLSLGLAPEVGGSVASFRRDQVDLMRPLSDADRAARKVVGAAMFPMAPYANRIAGNAFTFEGEAYRFLPNNSPEKFNVHGTAWHLPWREQILAADEALLTLEHLPADGPYRYAATQRFQLDSDTLTVTTMIENRGQRRMPFGFGQHPWFIRDPDVLVQFDAKALWIEGWDNTASERIATPPEFSFATRRLPEARRNNCYGLWDRRVDIAWPSRGVALHIAADPVFKHLMFYADPAQPTFCIEPQTNATCAFNLPPEDGYDLGIIVLEPGASVSGAIRFVTRSV